MIFFHAGFGSESIHASVCLDSVISAARTRAAEIDVGNSVYVTEVDEVDVDAYGDRTARCLLRLRMTASGVTETPLSSPTVLRARLP